jgi:hypothetical protein
MGPRPAAARSKLVVTKRLQRRNGDELVAVNELVAIIER